MTFQEKVDQFVSDAAYRIGEIGHEIDEMADKSNHECYKLKNIRAELSMFLSILRHTTMSIIDGTNFLDWDEYDILKECEYQRRKAGMNILPIINFTNNAVSVIIQQASSGSGSESSSSIPSGSSGDSLFYNVSGELYADSISTYGGAGDEDINTYFAGRP